MVLQIHAMFLSLFCISSAAGSSMGKAIKSSPAPIPDIQNHLFLLEFQWYAALCSRVGCIAKLSYCFFEVVPLVNIFPAKSSFRRAWQLSCLTKATYFMMEVPQARHADEHCKLVLPRLNLMQPKTVDSNIIAYFWPNKISILTEWNWKVIITNYTCSSFTLHDDWISRH